MSTRAVASDLLRSLQATAAANAGVEPFFEPLNGSQILNARNDELLARLADIDLQPLLGPTMPLFERNVYLGSLDSLRANGFTYRLHSPGGTERDVLIVCNTGLFNLLNLAVKCVSLFVESISAEMTGKQIKTGDSEAFVSHMSTTGSPKAEARFQDLLMSYARFGDPGRAAPYTVYRPDSTMGHFWPQLQFAERFVLAHEYGHIAKGNMASLQIWEIRSDGRNRPEDQHPEHTADDIGFRLIIAHAVAALQADDWQWDEDGKQPVQAVATAWAGTVLVFTMMSIVDRAVSILATGDELAVRDSTYPEPRDRLRYIAARAADTFGDDFVESIIVSVKTDDLLEELWLRVRPKFEEAHSAGVRPTSPMLPPAFAHLGDPTAPSRALVYPHIQMLEWWTSGDPELKVLGAEILYGIDNFHLQELLRKIVTDGETEAVRTVAKFLATIDPSLEEHIDDYPSYDFERQCDLAKKPVCELFFPDHVAELALSVDPTLHDATRVSDIARGYRRVHVRPTPVTDNMSGTRSGTAPEPRR